MWMNLQVTMLKKEAETREYMLYDFIYIKSNNWEHYLNYKTSGHPGELSSVAERGKQVSAAYFYVCFFVYS